MNGPIVAVIPARGGSQRIPKKNIRDFCGRPMLGWSVRAALACGLFDRVIVSTDDEEIAQVARQEGAQVPFMRPAELADHHSGTTEVVAHAVQWLTAQGAAPGAVCCMYATAPFVQAADLRRAYEALQTGKWAYVFTATEFDAPIFRAFQQEPEGGAHMFFPDHFRTRSQDLPVALHDAGQFYWGWASSWLRQLRMFEPHSHPLVIPRWRVQDIDTLDDWRRAELIFKALGFDQTPAAES